MAKYTPTTTSETVRENTESLNITLCPYHCNKQCELFPIGNFVFWLSNYSPSGSSIYLGGRYYLCFGEVIAHYSGQTTVQLYDYKERRIIEGVPANEFETPTRWQKLPKGWTYNTKLMHVTYEPFDENKKVSLVNGTLTEEVIRKAIENGILVKVQENDYSKFGTEIDKHKGWRIIRNYDGKYHPTYLTVQFRDLCKTAEEVKAKYDEIEKEFERQVALSDVEWSIEQIDHTLDRWAGIYNIPNDTKQIYRDYILQFDKIEDVEVRIMSGHIEWKYWDKKRWSTINL